MGGASTPPTARPENEGDLVDAVLITGTTGFVGSHLVQALRPSCEVIEVNRRDLPRSANSVVWDFRTPLGSELPSHVDVLVHCASPVGSGSDADEETCAGLNLGATDQLLSYARRAGARLFAFASTGAVYGLRPGARREEDVVKPEGTYSCSKAAGEHLVRAQESHMDTLCLRLFYPYGPGQRPPRLIPSLIERIRSGKPIFLNGREAGPRVSPLFIDDLVRWVVRLIQIGSSGTYNLAGREVVSIRELADRLAVLLDRPACFEYRAPVPGDSVGVIDRVFEATGICPQWTLEQGLAKTA
jgi:nucleoside-diphosphate-sugar epimerase